MNGKDSEVLTFEDVGVVKTDVYVDTVYISLDTSHVDYQASCVEHLTKNDKVSNSQGCAEDDLGVH